MPNKSNLREEGWIWARWGCSPSWWRCLGGRSVRIWLHGNHNREAEREREMLVSVKLNFSLKIFFVGLHMYAFWTGYVCQGQKTIFEGWFPPATTWDLGSDSSPRACMQALLSTEPSLRPMFSFSNSPRLKPMEWYHPPLGWVLPPRLTWSG